MAIHPPLLYVGFVVFTVPFAFAIGMLATGRVGDRWQIECRRWTLVAFTFLSVGIVLGAWWSYQVLGWGGFWGWDPVENAALLPWLCGTAYLHSTLVQERRGLMRVWNLSLSIATFALTILGTFLTRSGVITSVHAFSESDLGPLLIGFFFAVVIVGFGLIAWRGDRLRSPGGIDAPLGREGAFLLNNVLFVGFAFVVLLGTLYPLLYEAATQQQVTVGAPFFNTVAIPVGLTLLFLMAVAPVLSWRKINGAVLWQRLAIPVWIGVGTVVLCVAFGLRGFGTLIGFGLGAMAAATAARALVLSVRAAHTRHVGLWRGLVGRANGGMIVHLGVVLLAVGIIAATSYRHQAELALHKGAVVTYDGHRFEFEGLRTVSSPSRTSQEALVKVDGAVFAPATTSFGSALSVVGTPAIDSGLFDDVYLTFDAVGGLGLGVGEPGHQQPAAGVGGHRRGHRAAGGLALGRRPAHRGGGPARPGPGVAAPAHRPGLGLVGPGHGRRARAAPRAGRGARAGGRARGPGRRGPGMSRRRRHATRWVAGAVLLVLVVVGIVLATRTPQEATAVPSPLLGRQAPDVHRHRPRRRVRRSRWPRCGATTSWSTSSPAGASRARKRRPTSPASTSSRRTRPTGPTWSAWCSTTRRPPRAPSCRRTATSGPPSATPAAPSPSATGSTAPPTTFIINPAGRVTAVLVGPATQKNLDSFLKAARTEQAGASSG